MDNAAYLEAGVESNPHLEMMSSRMWTNVCFRYKNENAPVEPNALNIELRKRLLDEGRFMISRSNIGEDVILRPVLSNENVTHDSIDELLARIVHHGEEIVRGIPPTN